MRIFGSWGNFVKLVLFYFYVSPEGESQVSRLAWQAPLPAEPLY